ncbi:MAG: YebC/PmpR family DNA-binding transcriptional regulator [Planctomycetota bacterium]
MSGHSHWSGIKHKKALNDAKRGKVFSKLAALIASAVKEGGGPDPDMNPRLRLVLDKARASNMPKDNVRRAVEKGAGTGGAAYEQLLYEGYAPGGVALMIETLTDKRQRTYPEIKKIVEQRHGSLGSPGCVAYLFHRKGLITVNAADAGEEALLEAALDAGAEDLAAEGDLYQVTTPPEALLAVKAALEERRIPIQSAEIAMIPGATVRVEGEEARKVLALVEALDDHEDVQNVYTNFDIPDEILSESGN